MSDVPSIPTAPHPQDVLAHYYDLGPFPSVSEGRGRYLLLALECACGMISERVFWRSIVNATTDTQIPIDDGIILAEHAYNVFQEMLRRSDERSA